MDHARLHALPVLDADAFDALAFNDPELQRELLQAFLEQAPGIARDLDTLQDAPALREALHLLKGSCQCISAERLHVLLQEAEAAFAQPAPADRRLALLAQVREVLAATRQAAAGLNTELASRCA